MIRTLFCALVLTVVLLAQVTPALASCTYTTYYYGNRMVTCTTCCYFASCQTTCL